MIARRAVVAGFVISSCCFIGCGGERFSDRDGWHAWFSAEHPGSPAEGSEGTLSIILALDEGAECYQLSSDLAGRVNGEPMKVRSRGGWTIAQDGPTAMTYGLRHCTQPTLEAPMPPPDEALTTFQFSAGGDVLTATFQNMNTPTRFRWVAPTDGRIQPGQVVTLAYGPESHELGFFWVAFLPPSGVLWQTPELWQVSVAPGPDGRVSFQVPDDAPARRGKLVMYGARQAKAETCDGFAPGGCWFSLTFQHELPAEVVQP